MDQKDRIADDKQAAGKSQTEKKPYQKPSFRFERVFETSALACGKVSNRQKTCRGGARKSS
jgi:hypothetical protein